MTAPDWSVMTPVIAPVACANAGAVRARASRARDAARRRRMVGMNVSSRWRCLYRKHEGLSKRRLGQFQDGERDDLRRVHEVDDVDVFVRLVREVEDAGTVGHAV